MSFWDFLARFFAVPASLPALEADEHVRPSVRAAVRLAVVVGHNAASKGANSPTVGSEYDFNTKAARYIEAAASGSPVEVMVFYRRTGLGGYGAEMRELINRVNAWKPDCAFELHFNGFRTSAANGTETLHAGSRRGKALAELTQSCMLDCFGLKNRGLKKVDRDGRGADFLYGIYAPAIIPEPAFGTNPTDAASLQKNWPEFADDLIWLVQKWKAG